MDSNLDDFDEQETGRNPLRDRMKQLEAENAELRKTHQGGQTGVVSTLNAAVPSSTCSSIYYGHGVNQAGPNLVVTRTEPHYASTLTKSPPFYSSAESWSTFSPANQYTF